MLTRSPLALLATASLATHVFGCGSPATPPVGVDASSGTPESILVKISHPGGDTPKTLYYNPATEGTSFQRNNIFSRDVPCGSLLTIFFYYDPQDLNTPRFFGEDGVLPVDDQSPLEDPGEGVTYHEITGGFFNDGSTRDTFSWPNVNRKSALFAFRLDQDPWQSEALRLVVETDCP